MSDSFKLSENLAVIRYANGVIEFVEREEYEAVLRLNGTESDELVKWIKSLP